MSPIGRFGGSPRDHLGRELLGRAYQAADDLQDVTSTGAALGKPAQQDAAHARPNLSDQLGIAGARRRVEDLLDDAAAAIPETRGQHLVRVWLQRLGARLLAAAGQNARASG